MPDSGWGLKLGLPIGVLAAVVAGVLLIGGDGDEEETTASTLASPEVPVTSDPGAIGSSPEGDEASGQGKDKPGAGGGANGSGQGQGAGSQTPEGSGFPEGKPVGRVPKGAGPGADQEAVVRTLRSFLQAISRGNGFQACAQLTEEGRLGIQKKIADAAPETAGAPCSASIVLYQGGYGKAIRDPKITGVQVSGNGAKAVGPLHQPATLVKSGRLWQISRYGDDY